MSTKTGDGDGSSKLRRGVPGRTDRAVGMLRAACRSRTRIVAATAVLAVAAAACGADAEQADPDLTAPPAQTTAPPPTTEAVSIAPAEASAPVVTTEVPVVTTTTAPPEPAVIIWSAPRLNGTTLSASWQVTPGDANCSFDLLNEAGEVIGTGVPQVADGRPDGRGMRAEYDPASADALGAVDIRCSYLGGIETVVTSDVHRVTYKNRSPDSVLPATDEYYFDHDEVAALFPDCRPPRVRSWRRTPLDGLGAEYTAELAKYIDDTDTIHFVDPAQAFMPADYDIIIYLRTDGTRGVDLEVYLDAGLNFWEKVYENWDTETTYLGIDVASGWWTTEQLRMMYPQSTLTGHSVRAGASYNERWDHLAFAPGDSRQNLWVNSYWHLYPEKVGSLTKLENLYMRLNAAVGYEEDTTHLAADEASDLTFGEVGQWIRDASIAGDGQPNPPGVDPKDLLWDWVDARYRYPPIDREPTAWAMRTLLEARAYDCVGRSMRRHCESGEFHASPHMRHPSQGGSRLGSILWSAVCPDIEPMAQ